MKSSHRQPFSVESSAGQPIEVMRESGERPPRSAKLVAYIDFGSGPGGICGSWSLITILESELTAE